MSNITYMAERLTSIPPAEYNLTFEEKRATVQKLNNLISNINREPARDRRCANCQFFANGRCTKRDMADIPFDVQNRPGGCSMYMELDYIPF